MTRKICLLSIACWVTGCGAQSFQGQFKPPESPTERVVLAALTQQKPRDERPVAVGITSDPARLFAWDLSAGLMWERPVQAKSAPIVTADAVVMREAAGIVVRDLTSGEIRVVVDDRGELIGADGQGRSLVIAIDYGPGKTGEPRGAVAYVEGDHLRWKQPLGMPVGVPALASGYALVPWATQRLSALSAQTGAELARWDFTKAVLGYALVDRGRVYIGQHALLRLDERMLEQAKDAVAGYAPFKRPLPGQPELLRDGYVPVPEPDSANHRLRVDWRIGASEGALGAENDMIMLRFYRLLFALGANMDETRWIRTFDHDLVGLAIQPGGMFVADSAGVLRFLDASGVTQMQRDLGRSLAVLTIRPGTWVPVAAAAGTVAEAPLSTMADQLFAAAALDDARLGAARAYAVEQLALISDATVTAHLIELCSDRKIPQPVQSAACSHLTRRANGGEEVARALQRKASFLERREAPPVGALAQAAAQMQVTQAGPLLVTHLEDPNTQTRDLAAVLEAIEKLGHRPAGSAIERFVRVHHAEPEGSDLAPALYAGLHALGSLRVRTARQSLEDISQDAMTAGTVRDKAREAIALLDAPAAAAKPDATPVKPVAEEETQEVVTDPRPYSITAQMVRDALRPVSKQLSQCVASDTTRPRAARISMVIQGEGKVEGIFTTPATLQPCAEPLLRGTKFPATRKGRQRVEHVVHGPNAIAPPTKGKGASKRKKTVAKAGPAPAKPHQAPATQAPH